MKLATMMKLFGTPSDRKRNSQLCHQDLLEKEGTLIRFEDLPVGAFVMFVSHQWNGFVHPDPNGVQIDCMVKIFRRLRDGKISRVDMDPFHTILYNDNHVTEASEWETLMSNAYLWYDFWSQPQPSLMNEDENIQKATQDLKRAIASMGAYVERADCLVILVPATIHADRMDPRTGRKSFTCYRTFRSRAFCVMEMFAAYLSRRKTHPMLLVRAADAIPEWLSSLEVVKLAVGESDFTCCEQNHEGKFSTCDRDVLLDLLTRLIDQKVEHIFTFGNATSARLLHSFRFRYLRGLNFRQVSSQTIENFKVSLRWSLKDGDGEWFDRRGVSTLLYAVTQNDEILVRELLSELDSNKAISESQRKKRLVSELPKDGFVDVGTFVNKATLLVFLQIYFTNFTHLNRSHWKRNRTDYCDVICVSTDCVYPFRSWFGSNAVRHIGYFSIYVCCIVESS